MKETELLKNEKVITTSSNQQITLTTHRLRKVLSASGSMVFTSILLRNISSIYMVATRKPIYLFFSIIAFAGAAFMAIEHNEEVALISGIIGAIFIIVYFLSKSHLITVTASDRTKISLLTKGMKNETVLDFINKIETAVIQETTTLIEDND
jgi:hypothetical protein